MKQQVPDENEMLISYDNGEWESVKDLDAAKESYANYARNTVRKNKRVNIRLSEVDLTRLKEKSLEEGIPYQTLISSLIHKYVTGNIGV